MGTGRLEAFSDAVFAVIITIMVLEINVPRGDTVDDVLPLLPASLSYALSFVYVGIYWNNHHHLLHVGATVTGAMLWANLHLLFWLSLLPFATGWMGENHFSTLPILLYSVVLLMAGVAYYLLEQTIIRAQGPDSILQHAVAGALCCRGRCKSACAVDSGSHLCCAGTGLVGSGPAHRIRPAWSRA